MIRHWMLLLALLLMAGAVCGQDEPAGSEEALETISLTEGLFLPRWGGYGRTPLGRDAVVWHLARGTWPALQEGVEVEAPDGEYLTWRAIEAGDEDWFGGGELVGGYVAFGIESDADRVMILRAQGHSKVYIDGELRAGDPYSMIELRAPVLLRRGRTDLMFQVARGRLRAGLEEPARGVMLSAHDALLPDLIVGEPTDTWGSVMLTNATREPVEGLVVEATLAGGAATRTEVEYLPPLSFREVPFAIEGPVPTEAAESELSVRLMRGDQLVDMLPMTIATVDSSEVHQRTFLSDIDGSAQYYAVQPAKPVPMRDDPPALVLTLHGASVEGRGQAAAYSPKRWANIVAPTNRRPYGFDWEDWGRLDALEVLAEAKARYDYDPSRVYLTGHSMGGHGTWHLGVTFPDLFAAIGPSAGWVSFWSYGRGRGEAASAVGELIRRAASPSDTLALVRNARHHGVYILHGADDDNVPADQARTMVEALGEFHGDFVYHEEPGVGHWWNRSDEPGADCVDWAPMFDLFARHSRYPLDAIRDVRFTTASPGVSARCYWARIESQLVPLSPSEVDIRWDPWMRRFVGSTRNVSRLSLSLDHVHPGEPISVTLDGDALESIRWPASARLWLAREGGRWSAGSEPSPALKNPQRYGTFKDAFRNRMILVYGTGGSDEEARLARAKARYDAETFWYRGNGSVEVIPDDQFDPGAEPDRNVILYGNGDTNLAWGPLLGDSPVQVKGGGVGWGEETLTGDALACLLIRPRAGSEVASVGAVAVTGARGYHTAELAHYFVSGTAYPDYVVFGPDAAATGTHGALLAGFFGEDWRIESGEYAWGEDPR
ncbi:MAG: prolyl oligopeptidase family serine peptidase [Armatimonadia bacterium]|nr:prolyl oligopeptidase family serine peptidase [Armatimonadia bacterium]